MTLFILGAGGHGRVVAEIASASGETDIQFLDQSWPERLTNLSWPIVARDAASLPMGSRLTIAVGDNSMRRKVLRALPNGHFEYPVLVHPTAHIAAGVKLGEGTVVMPMAVINPGCVVGSHVIINTSASVDHDCVLADYVHVSPGAHLAGGVKVGALAWIGIGSSICEYRQIGENALVAAGAVVVQDVKSGDRVFGVPAVSKR